MKLEKGPQKANWAMRPLTERMERYARNDTHYLKPLADRLKLELEAKGRLAWQQESCARLIAGLDAGSARRTWTRFGGSKAATCWGGRRWPSCASLWQWRESEAVGANKPPFFVMSHEALVEIAAAAAAAQPIEPFLPRHFSERRRAGLLKAVARGLGLSPEGHPKLLRRISAAGPAKGRSAGLRSCRSTATPTPPRWASIPR